mmetsp:Transcript_16446/g.51436  ORF Transcript_16446/g.51436 Transcript_16446/m.51436 type:complete len:338 (-) Transcript_16446:762-1775(-)
MRNVALRLLPTVLLAIVLLVTTEHLIPNPASCSTASQSTRSPHTPPHSPTLIHTLAYSTDKTSFSKFLPVLLHNAAVCRQAGARFRVVVEDETLAVWRGVREAGGEVVQTTATLNASLVDSFLPSTVNRMFLGKLLTLHALLQQTDDTLIFIDADYVIARPTFFNLPLYATFASFAAVPQHTDILKRPHTDFNYVSPRNFNSGLFLLSPRRASRQLEVPLADAFAAYLTSPAPLTVKAYSDQEILSHFVTSTINEDFEYLTFRWNCRIWPLSASRSFDEQVAHPARPWATLVRDSCIGIHLRLDSYEDLVENVQGAFQDEWGDGWRLGVTATGMVAE